MVDLSRPLDISLPLREGHENPNCYWAEPPLFETIRMGEFVGSVKEGGPVNYQKVTITPHGNGTHTESHAHIEKDMKATVNNSLKKFIFICNLITVEPELLKNGDRVITESIVRKAPTHQDTEAIVVRTLPNTADKLARKYSGTNPAYFTTGAVAYLAEKGIKHLLIDLPSVDKEEDGGKLAGHRAFWYPQGKLRRNCTITELIFVPDDVSDGLYLLNLQICSLETDAAPSKPVLYYMNKN
ncbi:cyclase family protein [Roseivirga sp. BDSF3-8]|uniref:cyclase family protein n=1 Tax=Roseivirga sp. BDSF3-8 TaxID=3241598 RepID=UPI003531BC65